MLVQSEDLVREHGLTPEEYEKILQILGREPNLTELGIFSVMWSEHCSYKSSRLHLKKLPTKGPQVLQGPGENAGAVDIGDGLAAVFKIESHNHPSFIEPFQGAATGVGGIIRDIFTMGARPIALLDSLHFGPLDVPRNQLIMEGVVAGIASYGNCIGIPTVGGEVHFDPCYSANPIINVFCLGIAPADGIFRARAPGAGNPVIYVGAKTGRDGIHGATMASEEFGENAGAKRPNVQVGDPFLEKLLLEACLEAMASGAVVGIQDMGAAGLTCSSTEMAGNSGTGIELDLDQVPQRESGMTSYELMLSESQERMLLVAERGREDDVLEIFRKWDLDAVVVGTVAEKPHLVVRQDGKEIVDIPNQGLNDEAPLYDREARRPGYLDKLPSWPEVLGPEPVDYGQTLRSLLQSCHTCDRRWIYEQYDHMVQTNTVQMPGHDAAVVRLKGNRSALAMSLDGNMRYCFLNPRKGAMLAVAEACRNLVASGAKPLAATNCLNFGSPENPEVMWQFVETVEGLAEACLHFNTPITGGNVSFYNETKGEGILPTPVLGMIGKLDDVGLSTTSAFQRPGDLVYLLGKTQADLGGSLYFSTHDLPLCGPVPEIDLERESQLHQVLAKGVRQKIFSSIHDLSDGGLLLGLAESSLLANLGVRAEFKTDLRPDIFLLSESPSRALVSLPPQREADFLQLVGSIANLRIGSVDQALFSICSEGRVLIEEETATLKKSWTQTFPEIFDKQ